MKNALIIECKNIEEIVEIQLKNGKIIQEMRNIKVYDEILTFETLIPHRFSVSGKRIKWIVALDEICCLGYKETD